MRRTAIRAHTRAFTIITTALLTAGVLATGGSASAGRDVAKTSGELIRDQYEIFQVPYDFTFTFAVKSDGEVTRGTFSWTEGADPTVHSWQVLADFWELWPNDYSDSKAGGMAKFYVAFNEAESGTQLATLIQGWRNNGNEANGCEADPYETGDPVLIRIQDRYLEFGLDENISVWASICDSEFWISNPGPFHTITGDLVVKPAKG